MARAWGWIMLTGRLTGMGARHSSALLNGIVPTTKFDVTTRPGKVRWQRSWSAPWDSSMTAGETSSSMMTIRSSS